MLGPLETVNLSMDFLRLTNKDVLGQHVNVMRFSIQYHRSPEFWL